MSKTILGIKLVHREESAPKFQEIMTKYGNQINTRIGLHSAFSEQDSPQGIILIEFKDGAEDSVESFEHDLKDIDKADIQKMVFR